jgi:hypothetical protein
LRLKSISKLLRRGFLVDGRTAIPLRSVSQPKRITSYLSYDIGAFSRLALVGGPKGRSYRKTRFAPIYMPQPPLTVPSGILLDAKRLSSSSASSEPTFDPIQTTYHFRASSKGKALNDNSDDLDNRIAIYAIDILVYSLVYRQVIGEKQEIDI